MTLLLLIVVKPLAAAIVLPSGPPYTVAIDWDGIDDYDGDGGLAFAAPGDIRSATLRALCNATNGYQISFHSNQATANRKSYLENGPYRLRYRVSMDISGVSNANIRRANLNIKNPNSTSFKVKFNRPSNVLPVDGNTQANVIRLDFTLNSSSGSLLPVGTYTDIITATASLN